MAVSKAVQQAFYSPPRSEGEFFQTEDAAKSRASELKSEGKKNVRVSRFLNFKKANGERVYSYTVRHNV